MFLISEALLLVLVCNAALWAADDDDNDRQATAWIMSNDPAGNAVLAFKLANNQLTFVGSVSTGGTGTGGREPDFALGNAHPLQLSKDGRLMFVVNPGSNDISVFRVTDQGLTLLHRVASGGQQPLSVTVHDDLLYVVNGGGNVGGVDNITGFRVGEDGTLTQIINSSRPLSSAVTAPAEIEFTPNGKVLVVTEKATNNLATYTVGSDGRASGPIVTPSGVITPFGFDIGNRNQLFLSDDFNDAPGQGAMSTFTIADDGTLHLVSSVVQAHESGACWVSLHKGGRFALLQDTVSGVISVYSVNKEDGSVTFAHSFPSPFASTDLDFSHDGRFLLAVDPDENLQGSPGVLAWRFNPDDGTVSFLSSVRNLPRTIDGLIAR
jgi:6-phosphogluconolactonase (cycloisomerase 2 family)